MFNIKGAATTTNVSGITAEHNNAATLHIPQEIALMILRHNRYVICLFDDNKSPKATEVSLSLSSGK